MEQSIVVLPKLEYGYEITTEGRDSFHYPLHIHKDAIEFLLIMEGEGLFTVNGTTYRVGSGNLLCYNSGIWHAEENTSPRFSSLYLTFTNLKMKHLPFNFFLAEDQPPYIGLGEQFDPTKLLFMEIIKEKSGNDPLSDFAADQLLSVLLSRLTRLVHYNPVSKPKKPPSFESVIKAKRYIEKNYNTAITLRDLSKLTYINQYHLSHLFKAEFGISPIQYLIQYRMEIAKHYLLNSSYTVREIAELVGYESDTYFHQIFKKVENVSPGEFRERNAQGE